MNDLIQTFALTELDGEPRVLDLDIAERLGFARPRVIRELIDRHIAEFEALGICRAVRQNEGRRGRPSFAYLLNEEQALLAAVLSNAEHAPAVRRMLIQTFTAHRRGQLAGGLTPEQAELLRRDDGMLRMLAHKVTEMGKEIAALKAQTAVDVKAIEHAAVAVAPPMSRAFLSAIEVLNANGVPQQGRAGMATTFSYRLRAYYAQRELDHFKHPDAKRWMFYAPRIEDWLMHEGRRLIAEHMAMITGQSTFKFTPRVVK